MVGHSESAGCISAIRAREVRFEEVATEQSSFGLRLNPGGPYFEGMTELGSMGVRHSFLLSE
jgi:hypothetical protein